METGAGERQQLLFPAWTTFDVVRINYTYATLEFDVQQRGVMFICVETVA